MKKIVLFLMMLAGPAAALASGGTNVPLLDAKVDLNDQASLQRGARIFVNYCLSCHSASYMRYDRMGADLGIPEEIVADKLLFASEKPGDLMKAVMPREDAKVAFGAVPPDLSDIARSRTPDWLFTYFLSFYRDDRSPSGWNNTVFPGVAMPHVLWEWQGVQRPVYRTEVEKTFVEQPDGSKVEQAIEHHVFERFELAVPGTHSVQQYESDMRDLVNYLVYLGEPAKLVRYKIGIFAVLFLVVFTIVAYFLKKNFWKDLH